MRRITKSVTVVTVTQIVTAGLAFYIAESSKGSSFNGIQMVIPMMLVPAILVAFLIYLLLEASLIKRSKLNFQKYLNFALYLMLGIALILDGVTIYSTWAGR